MKLRRVLASTFLLFTAGCGATPTVTAPASTAAIVSPSTSVAPSIATIVWRDKLNGVWIQRLGAGGTTEFIIDIDGKKIVSTVSGLEQTQLIEFQKEEGKTVFLLMGNEPGKAEEFRFISDDLVEWTSRFGSGLVRLERAR